MSEKITVEFILSLFYIYIYIYIIKFYVKSVSVHFQVNAIQVPYKYHFVLDGDSMTELCSRFVYKHVSVVPLVCKYLKLKLENRIFSLTTEGSF